MLESVESKLPSRAELNATHAVAAQDAMRKFDARAVGPTARELRATLDRDLEEEHAKLHAVNLTLSTAQYKNVLERHIREAPGADSAVGASANMRLWMDVLGAYMDQEAKGCAQSEVMATIGLEAMLAQCVVVLRAEFAAAEAERKEAEEHASDLQQSIDLVEVDLRAVPEKLKRADDAIAKVVEEMAKTLKETRVAREETLEQKNKKLLLLKANLTTEKGKVDSTARNNLVLQAELNELHRVHDVKLLEKKYEDGIEEAEKLGERVARLHEEINKRKDCCVES